MRITHRIVLAPHRAATGSARHVVDGVVMPIPAELGIGRFPGEREHYLLYYDASGAELTDTLHGSLGEAMEQARFEFEVQDHEWVVVAEADA